MSLSLDLSLRFRLLLLGVNLEPTFDIKEPMVKKPTNPRKPDTLMLQKRSIRIDAMKQIKSLRSNKENITSNKKHDDDDDVPVRDNEQQGENNKSDSFYFAELFLK